MQITVGRHKSKSVELVVLKEPAYVDWLLNENVTGRMLQVKTQAQNLIVRFDAKPINKMACYGPSCNALAKRMSLAVENLCPYWWCSYCDPHSIGASYGKLAVVSTYRDAINHVQHFSTSPVADCRKLIKTLAASKGLPDRVGDTQAINFFAAML